jgi:hypothetical protein
MSKAIIAIGTNAVAGRPVKSQAMLLRRTMDSCRRRDDVGATLVVAPFPADGENPEKVPASRAFYQSGQGYAVLKPGDHKGRP